MLRLHDIMTRDIVTLSPEHTLREAMSILVSRHISDAPLTCNRIVVGVVSLTDLADLASSAPGVPTERPQHPDWGEWDDPMDMSDEPTTEYFRQLWDDAGAEVSERITESGGPEWGPLQEHTVAEAMTRDVRSLPSTTSVEDGARFMRQASIHRVLVMDDAQLLPTPFTE